MTDRASLHRHDAARLRRIGAHADATAALAAVDEAAADGTPVPVRVLQAAAAALRDALGAQWALGADESDAARLLLEGRRLANGWAATASTVASVVAAAPGRPAAIGKASALARAALWPCAVAAWTGGPVATRTLDAARALRAVGGAATAAALVPPLAHLAAALAATPDAAEGTGSAAGVDHVTDYAHWVADPGTPVAAADLHDHVPSLLRAALARDAARFDEVAARRRRHHEDRARRHRGDPGAALDLLAVVAATTAHRHGLAPRPQLPTAPVLLPGRTA